MTHPTKRIRVPAFPYAAALTSARLDAVYEEPHRQGRDLVVDFHELQLSEPLVVFNQAGKLSEHVRGHYIPRRLRFIDVKVSQRLGLPLSEVPLDNDARCLRGVLHWRLPNEHTSYLVITGSSKLGDLVFAAQRYVVEARPGEGEAVDYARDWSPAPSIPTRFMHEPRQVHQRYGGDPVSIHLGTQRHQRRLFVGGLDYQREERPLVDAVLNLGEEPSRWTASPIHLSDRWAHKGEGRSGMTVEEIIEEASWVIERLNAGQRVLVHCVAGFNRSVTVCCGVLVLLEQLSAEEALARVHQHHPWARPDSHHWLKLRWLAQVTGPSAE